MDPLRTRRNVYLKISIGTTGYFQCRVDFSIEGFHCSYKYSAFVSIPTIVINYLHESGEKRN